MIKVTIPRKGVVRLSYEGADFGLQRGEVSLDLSREQWRVLVKMAEAVECMGRSACEYHKRMLEAQ